MFKSKPSARLASPNTKQARPVVKQTQVTLEFAPNTPSRKSLKESLGNLAFTKITNKQLARLEVMSRRTKQDRKQNNVGDQ